MNNFLNAFMMNTDLTTLEPADFSTLYADRYKLNGSFYLKLIDVRTSETLITHLRVDSRASVLSGDVFRQSDAASNRPLPLYSIRSEAFLIDPNAEDSVIHVLCDVFVTKNLGRHGHDAHDKALLRLKVADQNVRDVEIVTIDNTATVENHARQAPDNHAFWHADFRRMEFEYGLDFTNVTGGRLPSGDSSVLKQVLIDLFGDGARGADNRLSTGSDDVQKSLENALAKAGIGVRSWIHVSTDTEMTPETRSSPSGIYPRHLALQARPSEPWKVPGGPPAATDPDPFLGLKPWRYSISFTQRGLSEGDDETSTIARTIGFADIAGATQVRSAIVVYLDPFLNLISPPDDPEGSWNLSLPSHKDHLRKRMIFALMHEIGHLLNMHHPWSRDVGTDTHAVSDPDALSWLAYGHIYPKGAIAQQLLIRMNDDADDATEAQIKAIKSKNSDAFYSRFFNGPADYSREELTFIRTAPYIQIAPGTMDLGSLGAPALQVEPKANSQNGFSLEITPPSDAVKFQFGLRDDPYVSDAYTLKKYSWVDPLSYRHGVVGCEPLTGSVKLVASNAGTTDRDCRDFAFHTGGLRLLIRETSCKGEIKSWLAPTNYPGEFALEDSIKLPQTLSQVAALKDGLPLPPFGGVPVSDSANRIYDFQVIYFYAPNKLLRSKPVKVRVTSQHGVYPDAEGDALRALLDSAHLLQLHYATHEESFAVLQENHRRGWIQDTLDLIGQAEPLLTSFEGFGWILKLRDDFLAKEDDVRSMASEMAGIGEAKRDQASHLRKSIERNAFNLEALRRQAMPGGMYRDFFEVREQLIDEFGRSLPNS